MRYSQYLHEHGKTVRDISYHRGMLTTSYPDEARLVTHAQYLSRVIKEITTCDNELWDLSNHTVNANTMTYMSGASSSTYWRESELPDGAAFRVYTDYNGHLTVEHPHWDSIQTRQFNEQRRERFYRDNMETISICLMLMDEDDRKRVSAVWRDMMSTLRPSTPDFGPSMGWVDTDAWCLADDEVAGPKLLKLQKDFEDNLYTREHSPSEVGGTWTVSDVEGVLLFRLRAFNEAHLPYTLTPQAERYVEKYHGVWQAK